jgi:alpha-L-arabinofuranosidase
LHQGYLNNENIFYHEESPHFKCGDSFYSGQIIMLTSNSNKDNNSFDEPDKVSPVVSEYTGFGIALKMEFEPNSFTILKINASG